MNLMNLTNLINLFTKNTLLEVTLSNQSAPEMQFFYFRKFPLTRFTPIFANLLHHTLHTIYTLLTLYPPQLKLSKNFYLNDNR